MRAGVAGLFREFIGILSLDFTGFALVHESALWAWGLTYRLVPRGLDAVVTDVEYQKTCPYAANMHQSSYTIGDMRIWNASRLGIDDLTNHLRWSQDLSCQVLEPSLVLELLFLSPDYRYLLEDRARLAMVLFADDMTDEELLEFNRYVRGF